MKKTKLSYFALAAMTFISCSKNEEVKSDSLENAQIVLATNVNNLVSRAANTTETLTSFGICINNSANSTYSYNNVSVSGSSSDGWTPASELRWENSQTPVDIVAYSPFKEGSFTTETTDFGFSVLADQRGDSDANVKSSDLLFFKSKQFTPGADGKLPITFSHALSMLKVEVTLTNEFAHTDLTNNPISSARMHNVATAGVMDFSAENPAIVANQEKGNIYLYNSSYSSADKKITYECILMPQTSGNDFNIVFKGTKDYYYVPDNNLTFDAGTCYTLKLAIGEEVVQVSPIQITDWTTGQGGDLTAE